MALSLSLSILATLFSIPALFLSIYNFLQTRMIMKDLDLDREREQPTHSLNTGRNIVDGMGMGRPATKDNIFDGDDDNDNFDYNI